MRRPCEDPGIEAIATALSLAVASMLVLVVSSLFLLIVGG